jgi:tRNA pseudouridine38-40 synthase
VQQHLEEGLAQMLGHEVAVTGASRTDAGVHARAQVASFRTERTIPLHGIRRGMNAILPPQIAIVAAEDAPEDFHPRFSATGKHYRYSIFVRPDRSPRWRDRAWHRPQGVDVARMQAAAAALIGEHDFAAFRAAGCAAKTTRRRIDAVDVAATASEPDLVTVDVRGNAFLRHMVRIVTGTLVEVGEGRREIAEVAEILASCDRTRAGQTAPPHGLELLEVFYGARRL